MKLTENYSIKTRISDLDSQRHVGSRAYSDYCYNAILKALENQGITQDRMQSENLRVLPAYLDIKFANQQGPDRELTVKSEIDVLPEGKLDCRQEILDSEGKSACIINSVYRTLKENDSVDLLAVEAEPEAEKGDIPEFSGACDRHAYDTPFNFSERNHLGDFSTTPYMRILEDARWEFFEKKGIDFDTVMKLDTTMFWMKGQFNFIAQPPAGQNVRVYTWIESFEKIRCYVRQAAVSLDGETTYFTSRQEHLIVSVAKARPRKAPVEYLNLLESVTEKKAVNV